MFYKKTKQLIEASKKNDIDEVTALLEKGAPPHSINTFMYKASPMKLAVEMNLFDIAEMLIEFGFDFEKDSFNIKNLYFHIYTPFFLKNLNFYIKYGELLNVECDIISSVFASSLKFPGGRELCKKVEEIIGFDLKFDRPFWPIYYYSIYSGIEYLTLRSVSSKNELIDYLKGFDEPGEFDSFYYLDLLLDKTLGLLTRKNWIVG